MLLGLLRAVDSWYGMILRGPGCPWSQQVLEFEDLLGLRPKAVTSLRSDLFTFTYMMDTFETRDLLLHQQVQTFTPLPPPHPSL